MPNTRNRPLTAREVLDGIMELPSDDSGDESDRESDNDEDVEIQHDSPAESSDEEDVEAQDEEVEEVEPEDNAERGPGVRGRDGTIWENARMRRGRAGQEHIFRQNSGPTRMCNQIRTPIDAFRLLFDQWIMEHIVECTMEYSNTRNDNHFNLTEEELEKYIGLLYLRGVLQQKNFPFKDLWSAKWGCSSFNSTMSRNKASSIQRYIRFDSRRDRRQNLANDKFCMISPVLNRFVENSQRCYTPKAFLTIDEQLFPTKARCRFQQYMPNKPDKFGIKFWLLAEVESKYCLSMKPYLGRDEDRGDDPLPLHVVTTLARPFYRKSYNICMDNFFTSKLLAERLLEQRTTLVGTIRQNRRELPPPERLDLYDTKFYESGDLHLTRYQAKRNKTVNILSTTHSGSTCDPDGKKKPDTIHFYNENKVGVDILDSMARMLSTKAGCRRWPLAVFFNILDMAGINAWILFRQQTNSRISRRNFLLELSAQLRRDDGHQARPQNAPVILGRRVTCQINSNCQKNKTTKLCSACEKAVCGSCATLVCSRCG